MVYITDGGLDIISPASVLILLSHQAGIPLVSAFNRWSCGRSAPRGAHIAGSQLAVTAGFSIPTDKHR